MSDEDRLATTRRIWGKGFRDGLAAAGKLGDDMNQAKLRAVEQSLNGMQRKVWDLLPIKTAMSLHEIMSALGSKGVRADLNVVEAATKDMVDRGIVKQINGRFSRIAVHARPEMTVISNESIAPKNENCPPYGSIIEPEFDSMPPAEQVLYLATILSGIEHHFVSDLATIRGALEKCAVRFEEGINSAKKGSEKLDALKSILKDL